MNTTQAHVCRYMKRLSLGKGSKADIQEKLCDDLDPEPENTNVHTGKARVMFRGPLVELALQSEV